MNTMTETEKLFNHLLAQHYVEVRMFCKRKIAELSEEAWDEENNCWHSEYDHWHAFNDSLDVNFFTDDTFRPTMRATVYLVMDSDIITSEYTTVYMTKEKSV